MMPGRVSSTRDAVEAERILDAASDAAEAVAVVAGWLDEMRLRRKTDVLGTTLSPGSVARELPARLARARLGDWVTRFELRNQGGGHAACPGRVLAELVMGAGLGRLCGRRPEEASFQLAEEVVEAFGDVRLTFPGAADIALAETPGAEDALTTLLLAQVNDFTAAPCRMARLRDVNTCTLVEGRRSSPRLSDAWDEARIWGRFRLRWPEAFDMLRRCNARSYLNVLEAFPHPEPVRLALEEARLEANPAALAELLKLAPCAFDANGAWSTDAKTPFLLLGIADRAIHDLAFRADGSGKAGAAAEALSGPVIDALQARSDAAHLG